MSAAGRDEKERRNKKKRTNRKNKSENQARSRAEIQAIADLSEETAATWFSPAGGMVIAEMTKGKEPRPTGNYFLTENGRGFIITTQKILNQAFKQPTTTDKPVARKNKSKKSKGRFVSFPASELDQAPPNGTKEVKPDGGPMYISFTKKQLDEYLKRTASPLNWKSAKCFDAAKQPIADSEWPEWAKKMMN